MENEVISGVVPQKITLELTPQAAVELERIRQLTSATKAELFRHAFSLLRIYVRAAEAGQELTVIDPTGKQKVIQLPLDL